MARYLEINEHAPAQQREAMLETSLPDTRRRRKRRETEALSRL